MGQPSQHTIKRLFAVSGNVCAFPGCAAPLVDEASGKVTGRISHIKGRSPGGPRYDPDQSEDERHAFGNLVLMCPVHHDVIDADPISYTVERLQQIKAEHEEQYAGVATASDEIANGLLANIASNIVSGGSVVTSINQFGGQSAHSITNIGDRIERQIVLHKQSGDRLTVDAFSIDNSRCAYQEHRFDPSRPFWPEDADPITVCYMPGGKIKVYGKIFSAWEDAERYGNELRECYNHYSFYEDAPYTMYLERLGEPPDTNKPNYPIFYVVISNHENKHTVMSAIEAQVHAAQPLPAIGESHALLPLNLYQVELSPAKGRYRMPAIPSLKIEAGDAAAFYVLLKPNVEMLGGYHWLITLHFLFGGQSIQSDTFAIGM